MDQQPYGAVKINKSSIVRGLVIAVFIILFFLALGWLLQSGWLRGGDKSDDESSLQTNVPEGVSDGEASKKTLTVNSKLLAKGGFFLTPSVQPASPVTGQILYNSETNILQYYNGTEYVDLVEGVTSIGGSSGAIVVGGGLTVTDGVLSSTVTGGANYVAGTGISINGATLNNTGVISISGTTDQVNVNTNSGTVTLSLPQSIALTSTPTFAGINLGTALSVSNGGTGATTLTANGVLVGNGTSAITSVTSGVAGECLISTAGAPVFQSCPGGGGAPTSAPYLLVTNDPTLTADRALAAGSNISFSDGGANGSFTVGVIANPSFNSLTLSTPLTVANGGTGANTLATNGVLVGNGTGAIASVTAGGAGQCLVSTGGAPTFQACPGTGGVSSVNSLTGALTVQGTANQVNVFSLGSTITLSTPQDIATTSSPTFNGLTLTSLTVGADTVNDLTGTGLQVVGSALQTTLGTSVDLTTEVTGVLPVANGGTGAASHTSGGILFGNGAGAFTNSGVLTNGQLLIGDGTGAPTAATLTQGTGIAITNGAGSILVAVDGTVCRTSGNCAGVGGVGDILQNGNSFTAAMTIGTNDAFDLNLETSGLARLTISSGGDVTIANNASVNGNTTLGNAITDNIVLTGAIQGTNALIFDGATDDANEITLAITDPGADFTITVPAATGTLCLTTGNCAGIGGTGDILNNGQNGTVRVGSNDANSVILESNNVDRLTITSTGAATFSGTLTVTGLTTLNGGLTIETGDTFTFNSDAFTDLTGTGLVISTGSLQTTLGTSVDLTSEITGTLPIANGGTNATTAQGAINNISGLTTNGDLLYFDGTNSTRLPRGTNGQCLLSNATTILWTTCTGDGTGVTTIGALDGGTANANGATITGTTLFLQSASSTNPGLVNTTTQTFAGAKTFDNNVTVNGSLFWVGPGTGGAAIALSPSATGSSTVDFNNLSGTDHITFDNNTDVFTWKAAGVDQLQVSGSGLTVIGGTTLNGGLTVQAGDTFTFNSDAFTDLTGDGLQISTGSLAVDSTVCRTSGNCSGVGGTGDILNNGQNGTVRIGSNNLNSTILETNNIDRLTIDSAGAATFSGSLTATGLATLNGGLTIELGDTFTFNGDAFTDLTGTGLTISGGALQTTLGTNIDLTSEVTGILPIANGGTNASTSQGAINNISQLTTNGDLLYHNGTNSTRLARGTNTQCLLSNATTILWGTCTGDGAGVTTVGAYGGSIANGLNITGSTISLGAADATNPGGVSTNAQTFGGAKTFSSLITGQAGITSTGGAVTLTGNAASSLTTTTGALTLTSAAAATWGTGAGQLTLNGFGGVLIGTNTQTGTSSGVSVITGNSTSAGNTGSISFTTGQASSGTSGSISLDIGAASTGTPGINIGTANNYAARTISLGGTTQTGTITLGQSTATNTIAIGNANTGTGNTQTINIGAGTPGGTGLTNITIGNLVNGGALNLRSGTGNTNLQSGGNVTIGTSNTTATLFVLDTKTDAEGALAGVNGGMYYNSNLGKFRCYEGGAWKDCITSPGGLFTDTGTFAYLTQNTDSMSFGGTTDLGAKLQVVGTSDQTQLLIRANATQTNPLIVAQNSAGTELFRLNAKDQYSLFWGFNAGAVDDGTSNENIGIGHRTLQSVVNGEANVGIGAFALQNTTGSNNIALGSGALTGNTTGSYSVAIGSNAGNSNTGDFNVIMGHQALQSATSTDASVILGSGAGSLVSTGDNNILVGYQSGDNITSGSNNIIIGHNIDASSATVSNELKIGSLIQGSMADGTNLTLLPLNNGETSAWGTTSSLGTARSGPSGFVSANGYVYAIGGEVSGGVATASVEYAKINGDGTLGTWTTTTSLPAARTTLSATYYNGYIYAVGGCSAPCGSASSTIYYAKVNADGTLGTWKTNSNNLPASRSGAGVNVVNGYMYVIAGSTASFVNVTNTSYYAKVNADGSVGNFSSTSTFPASLFLVDTVVANGYIYSVGGVDAGQFASSAVYYATLNADGTLGTWQTNANSLPAGRSTLVTGVSNGYLYAVGGLASGWGSTNTIYYGRINSDGTVSAFSTSAYTLPANRGSSGGAIVNGYIYNAGGYDGGYQSSVYYASTSSVKVGGNLDLVGLQGSNLANGGEGYTGSMGGSITAGNGTFVGSLRVQGDSSFTGGASFLSSLSVGDNVLSVDTSGPGKVTILGNTSGETGSWSATSSLNTATSGAATASANGYVYMFGGYNSVDAQLDVSQYAKINADGTVGAWATTTPIPNEVEAPAAVVLNGFIYIIAGQGFSDVHFARINNDGSLGSWQQTTSIPANRRAPAAFSANGYIYVVGGHDGSAQTTAYYARVNADGTIGSWNTTSTLPNGRAHAGYAIANGYAYIVGGSDASWDGNPNDDTYYAKINNDGTLGSWSSTELLPGNRKLLTAGVSNGYLYAFGGATGTSSPAAEDDVYYAQINSDGTVDPWSTSSITLPATMFGHASVVVNGYGYVMGGDSPAGVYSSAVNFARLGKTLVAGGNLDLVGIQGGNLSDGSLGGSLTAGNTNVVGTLSVQGYASFQSDVAVRGNLTVHSSAALYGDLLAANKLSSTTATTSGTGTNTTTLTFTGTTSFADNDVLYIDNAGQDFVTRIVSGGNAASVTVSPAVTFENARTVTKYESFQNIGATTTDYTNLNNRFFQGYFLGGIVAGTGSTLYGDQKIASTGDLTITATSTNIKSSTNSTTAFQVQNSSGATFLNADTINNRLEVAGNIYSTGLSWNVTAATAANQWDGVAYGNNLFVAVSSSGTSRVMTSPDGINWTARTVPIASWRSIVYGDGLFVAVGGNAVMTSPDGINWTSRTSSDLLTTWTSVTYGNGLFVAVATSGGAGTSVMTSPDGITWTTRSVPEANAWVSVTYGNGTFVAVSNDGTNRVMTSTNGTTWTARSAAEANAWNAVTYGNGLFVAVSLSGTNRVMTSPNGITWTARSAVTSSWWGITYGNGLFVAVGSGSVAMTSPDGINWASRAVPENNWWWGITYGNGMFVSVATSGTNRVMTSGSAETVTAPSSKTYQGGLTVNGSTNIGGSVIDSWVTRTTPTTNNWYSVTYGNGTFVAVAYTGSGNRVMTSTNGTTWTARTSAADNEWQAVTYGNGLFVAVAGDGVGNRVMTSPDGITWTIRTSAADNEWLGVTYGNGLFVAVSSLGTSGNRVMTSPDGINWTLRASASDSSWQSVTYGNGLFVAVAGGAVMTSPDGITWTSRTAASGNLWSEVTYGNGLFVAVASSGTGNRVMTSPDGITWTSRTSAADNNWNSVAYGNGLFAAVSNTGSGNRVMTSPDGITWTIRASAADNSWFSITYGNGMFVAVSIDGSGNRVMTSQGKQTAFTSAGSVVFQDTLNVTGAATFGSTISYVSGTADTNTAVCRNSLGQLAACTSSQRYKSDVADLTLGLDALRQLQPVSYTWNTTGQQDLGFIAEEVAAIIPQAVTYNENGEVASFNPHVITALLVASAQDLDLQVQDIEDRLTQIELGNFAGNVNIAGGLKVSGVTELATLKVNGKIITAGGTPTITSTIGTASIAGNDTAGTVSYTAGSISTGNQVSITFSSAYAAQPRVTLTPTNAGAASVRFFVERTTAGFTISFIDPPVNGTSYTFDYQILQ